MWPYTIVFIWFAIFAFELTAFVASMTHFALGSSATYEEQRGRSTAEIKNWKRAEGKCRAFGNSREKFMLLLNWISGFGC